MTAADLKEQVTTNKRVSKLLAGKINVTDEEVVKYIKDNKLTAPKGQEATYNDQVKAQLLNQKLNQAANDWLNSLKSSAKINYFVSY